MVGGVMDGTAEQTLRLLERQASGEIDRDELFDHLDGLDPQVGLLARLASLGRTEGPSAGDRSEAAASQLEDAMRMTDEARRLAGDVRREFDEVLGEVAVLRTRLDGLAAAVGACPGCWGEDLECRWCRGRGAPGTIPPDRDAFDRLVMPAVRFEVAFRRRDRRLERPVDRLDIDERRSA